MILGFKPQFVPKILDGTKLHTIRSGNRWKPGMSIQMATGVRTPQYNQFNADRPDLQVCKCVQDILFRFNHECDIHIIHDPDIRNKGLYTFSIFIDGKQVINKFLLKIISKCDGFDTVYDFIEWFYDVRNQERNNYVGQIIHWTEYNTY